MSTACTLRPEPLCMVLLFVLSSCARLQTVFVLEVLQLFKAMHFQPARPNQAYLDAWDLRRLWTYTWRRQRDAQLRDQTPRDWWVKICGLPSAFVQRRVFGVFRPGSLQDPAVARLFERIAEIRSCFLDDELNAPEEAVDDDDAYFVAAPSSPGRTAEEDTLTVGDIEAYGKQPLKDVDATVGAAEAAVKAPVTAATLPAAPGRHRSIPSLDHGFSKESLGSSIAGSTASSFVPPEMTDKQKQEVANLLKQIRALELSGCLVCNLCCPFRLRMEFRLTACASTCNEGCFLGWAGGVGRRQGPRGFPTFQR